MTKAADRTAPDAPQAAPDAALTPERVRAVVEALDAGRSGEARALAAGLHAADLADLFQLLSHDGRMALIEALGAELDPEVLSELEEGVRDDIVASMPAKQLAAAVAELDSDDAAYVLEDLEADRQAAILAEVPAEDRAMVVEALLYPEGTAGRLMQREVVRVPPDWNVGQVIDFLREADDLPGAFFEIYVVDREGRPIGAVAVSRLLRAKRPVPVRDLMQEDFRTIPAATEGKEVSHLFAHYGLVSAPVTDAKGRLAGMLTIDDVVEVISDEAEAQVFALGGVSEESDVADPVIKTTRLRFSWLAVNLVTAILASLVIGLFEAAIEKVVALAILMPIVASMGGNAGTQTLTVAVRALATKDLTAANAVKIVWKETVVGGLNGFLFALIMGGLAAAWFGDPLLGLVIGVAMVVNLVAAGLSGVLIPLAMHRLKFDPAVSATVFLTTVTDVVGFFVFLGLGAWLLI